jgi:hypothetical protein
LPACKSVAFVFRIWLFLFGLCGLSGESWLESWAESALQALRHLRFSVSGKSGRTSGFEKGDLAVNERGREKHFLPRRELAEFYSNGIG